MQFCSRGYFKKVIKRWEIYAFLTPALLFLLIFMLYPVAQEILLSFQDYNLSKPWKRGFIGLGNYGTIIKDPLFWLSLKNSIFWVAGSVSIQFCIGLIIALILNQKFKGRNFFRTVSLLPWAMSGVLTALMWRWIYHGQIGVLNAILLKIGLINRPRGWLSEAQLAMPSLIFANVWKGTPFFIVTMLAALQSIPPELYEAADIDGANGWQSFRYITFPLIKGMIIITTLLRSIWTFNYVDIIYVMTGGGPAHKTQTLAVYIFNTAFTLTNFGYGAALATVLVAILMIFTVIYLTIEKA